MSVNPIMARFRSPAIYRRTSRQNPVNRVDLTTGELSLQPLCGAFSLRQVIYNLGLSVLAYYAELAEVGDLRLRSDSPTDGNLPPTKRNEGGRDP